MNPNAKPFVPSKASSKPLEVNSASGTDHYGYDYSGYYSWQEDGEGYYEASISEEELAELELVDEWVTTQAYLDELEHEHLIAMALKEAPERAAAIEAQMIAQLAVSSRKQRRSSSGAK